MPVPAQPRVNRHTGNGVTDTWAYGFRILNKLDIGVDVDGALLTVDVDYTVTDVGEANGGTIVFAVPPANLAKITLYSNAAYARVRFDYVRNGAFKEETVDADFDQLTILIQQIDERFGRGLSIPISDSVGTNVQLPSESDRAGMILTFDAMGNVTVLAPADIDLALVSPFIATLLDDLDAEEARATLEALGIAGGSMSGAINESRASVTGHATDTPIWAAAGNAVEITGTPTITDFPDAPQAGAVRRIFPAAGAVITNNANISVQGGADYTFAAGDWCLIEAITTATFRATVFRASGASGRHVGDVFIHSGTTAPAGALALPTAPTNISRTTYAKLFAAIGTTWGVGDGSTTFGMPYLPANQVPVQANGNVGTSTVGEILAHTHGYTRPAAATLGSQTGGNAHADVGGTLATSSTGGSANLPAGTRMLYCVQYQ